MLSKELKDLEMPNLIKRTVYDSFPPTVLYAATKNTITLHETLIAWSNWGKIKLIKNFWGRFPFK
ncbi:MAG: helix-turn-helix transcriptional regulator [Bacteroidetes bacterium]|nr:helix-turn-helix transcriptional regulator [Bacteroidota bacterium]